MAPGAVSQSGLRRAKVGSRGIRRSAAGSAVPAAPAPRPLMEHIDMRPAKVHALLAGTTETVGGTLLAAGLADALASAAMTGVMTTAIRKVHLPNGPWAANA